MVEDVFAAISAVENEVKKNADETMKQGFGLNKNITEILLGMMYTGELPIQYYMDRQVQFLIQNVTARWRSPKIQLNSMI